MKQFSVIQDDVLHCPALTEHGQFHALLCDPPYEMERAKAHITDLQKTAERLFEIVQQLLRRDNK